MLFVPKSQVAVPPYWLVETKQPERGSLRGGGGNRSKASVGSGILSLPSSTPRKSVALSLPPVTPSVKSGTQKKWQLSRRVLSMPSATPSISKQQFQAQSAGSVCVGNASRRNLGSSRSQSVCVRSTGPKQKEVSAGSARKNTPKVLFVPKACSEDPVLTKGSWERPTFWKGRPPSKVTQRLCGTQFDPRKGRWSPKMPWEWVCPIHTCGLVIKGLTWASIRQGISMPVVNTRKLTLPFSTLSNPMSLLPPHLTSLLPNGLGAVPCVLTASELNYQVKNGPFVPIVPLVTPKRPCVHCVT